MSEKARGKRKATEMDDEGAENEEKTDGGRKRRRVTVKDPEETDWVKKVHQEILKIHIRHYEPPKCIVDGRLRYELVTIL